MEISLILDNKLIGNYDFSKREKKELITLDGFINGVRDFDVTKMDKKEFKTLDNWLGTVRRKNGRLYKVLVFSLAVLNYSTVAFADINDAYARLDKGGYMALGVLKRIGFWLCIICCFVEILRSFLNNDAKDVWKIFFKYISIFLVLYSLPVVFDFIVKLFEA